MATGGIAFGFALGRFGLVRLGDQRSHTPEAPEGDPPGLTAYLALFLFEFLFESRRNTI